MKRSLFAARVVVPALCMLAATGRAQVAPFRDAVIRNADINLPRIWCWNPPLGDAAADLRFVQMVTMDLYWSRSWWTGWSRSGSSFGTTAANTIALRNLHAGQVALLIQNLGKGYLRDPSNVWPNSADQVPALFAHDNDLITYVGRDRNNAVGLLTKRTPWLAAGIAEQSQWTDQFIAAYRAAQQDNPDIPNIDRLFQDEEVDDQCNDTIPRCYQFTMERAKLGEVVDYWNALKADPRWASQTMACLPMVNGGVGFDCTLRSLWIAAGSPEPQELPPGTPNGPNGVDWNYVGASQRNHAWYTWWRSVMEQSYSGAMHTAVYSKFEAAFPECRCGDYNRSRRLSGTSGRVGSDFSGAIGSHPVWDGKGKVQLVEMYPQISMYHFASYSGVFPGIPGGAPVTARTQDYSPIPWAPYSEPVTESMVRVKRRVLDACVESNNGAYRWSIVPYMTLPNQLFVQYGQTLFADTTTDPLSVLPTISYGTGVTYRVSGEDVRRALALAKSRGARELVIWNDNRFTVSCAPETPDVQCLSVHSQFAPNWSRFKQILDEVWKPSLSSMYVSVGTPAGAVPAASLSALKTAPDATFTVTEPANSTMWLSTQFALNGTNQTSWRLDLELVSTIDATVYAEAYDTGTPAAPWKAIDLDPATTGLTRTCLAGQKVRASGVVSGAGINAAGRVNVRLRVTPLTLPSVSNPVAFDLVQLVASDTLGASPGDFNGDGVVNVQDMVEYNLLWRSYYYDGQQYYAERKIRPYVDYDRDGVVTEWDWVQFNTAWTNDPARVP